MAVNLSPIWGAGAQLLDNSGNVLSGGKIYTYAAGTTTQVATYTSNTGVTANSNPIILNSAGRVPYEIWLTDGQNYKFVLKDSNDVLIGTWDNLSGINSNFVAYTNQQEIQTATAGQTVFNLTTMQYLPGTNSLSVFVDGVNQYGPGAQYAFTETNQTTVTFASGLHVGAEVKFTSTQLQNAGAVDASQVSYDPPFTDSVATNVEAKLAQYVSVKDFGAAGDGVTNDTVAIQNAIDAVGATGGTLYFPSGTYKIARTVGTNDHWGLKVPYSNITLVGEDAYLSRYDSDISTYALAYPLLFLGQPDSNSTPVSNITVDGLYFQGNDTQHSSSGDYINDNRTAIVCKNTSNTSIQNCKFFTIDSSAIYYQSPVEYDYTNSVFYNTTKNYISEIINCEFYTTSHAVAGRALVHAIVVGGVDNCRVANNYFSWCDDCIAGETTYDGPWSIDSATYTPTVSGWTLGAVQRCGRDWIFSNNNIYNSSEHAVYFAGVDVVVSDNTFYTNIPSVCNADPVKIRSRGATVTGNVISNYKYGITVSPPSFNVTVTGNSITISGDGTSSGAAIDVISVGLSTYINNRSDYLLTYYAMWNISIANNNILFLPAAAGFGLKHTAIRLYTDTSDANYPDGQLIGVSISGNTITNYTYGIYVFNHLLQNVEIIGNTFTAKAFTLAGFSTGTSMNTYAPIVCHQSGSASTETLTTTSFDSNIVYGCKYLIATDTAAGSVGAYNPPFGVSNNTLRYVQYIKTSDVAGFSGYNQFNNNSGNFFLDRTWSGAALNNSLGDGSTSNSYLRYTFSYDGVNMKFYTNDSGSSIQF